MTVRAVEAGGCAPPVLVEERPSGALAVLDKLTYAPFDVSRDLIIETRATVAELVKADREYDEARLAYQRVRNALLPHEGAAEKVRFLAADARRAAALALFRGV